VDAPAFIVAQLLGAFAATAVFRWLVPARPTVAPNVVDRHGDVEMMTVLFACVHNAGRSQMAGACFNALVDPRKGRALSAGTEPGAHVHPEVLVAMKEVGVDLANVSPQLLTDDLARRSQLLITMGCGEACPVVPGLRREDWPLDDPKGQPVERVRAIRDEIRARVEDLVVRESLGR
jgi:arsenate reductase